jgi:regulator of replication initiation timing
MSNINEQKLRELAERAGRHGNDRAEQARQDRVAFIAAANPATVIALLDRIAELREALGEACDALDSWIHGQRADLVAERDSLRARLAEETQENEELHAALGEPHQPLKPIPAENVRLRAEVDALRARLAAIEPVWEALRSLRIAIATSARDYSLSEADAWVYGVIFGWGPLDDRRDMDAMPGVAARHGWSDETQQRLQRYARSIDAALAAEKEPSKP